MKASYNLAEVVQETHPLRFAAGSEYVGTCPFHDEKTPSFRVNKQRFKCFGCGVHGDIISWITRTRGLSFQQAIGSLLKRDVSGGNVYPVGPKKEKSSSDYDAQGTKEILDINNAALAGFIRLSKPDKIAKQYMKSRFTQEQIDRFNITYYGESLEIISWLGKDKNDAELLISGLVGQDSLGRLYPRLRDRVIFPLVTKNCNVAGFAGRIVPRKKNEDYPKYVNPPLTKAYNKSNYLYGWPTFDPTSKTAFLVEGYMDVLALDKCGIKNVFAVGGTTIAQGQINTLETYFKTVYVMFDGDMPGLTAAAKSVDRLFSASFDTKYILLTDNHDPDSLSKDGDKKIFNTYPIVKITDFMNDKITTKALKETYDRSTLDSMASKFVLDNIKQGFPHYNVVDWVMQAYPQYAKEIKETTLKMVKDVDSVDGKLKLKKENVAEFLRAWIKPCREVRKKHNEEN